MSALATTAKTLLTADDLARMPNQRDYELIDGELLALLRNYLRLNTLGWVFGTESGYECFGDEGRTLRRPDVSFVRFGRFPDEQIPEAFAKLAPDLAVEIVSPGDRAGEIQEKIEQFLKAGVRLIWVVYPKSQSVHVFRVEGTNAFLSASEELSGEDVIPGFRCPVAELFPPANPAGTSG